jgi:hypothetical protein
MKTESIIERMVLDNYHMDDYDFIQCEEEDLKRTVSDGSLESEIVLSVSDFVFNK